MSIRAYNRREHVMVDKKTGKERTVYLPEDEPSFNLWHDDALMDALSAETGFYSCLNDDSCGIATITAEEFENVKKYLKKNKKLEEAKEEIANIEADFKATDDGFVEYNCY